MNGTFLSHTPSSMEVWGRENIFISLHYAVVPKGFEYRHEWVTGMPTAMVLHLGARAHASGAYSCHLLRRRIIPF